jgi:hypothetical protein
MAFDGSNRWITNQGEGPNTATKLRTSDGAVLGTFPVGKNPVGVAFDGFSVWVRARIPTPSQDFAPATGIF